MARIPAIVAVVMDRRMSDRLCEYHATLGRTRDCLDSAWHREAWEALSGEEWPEEREASEASEATAPAHTYCALCSPGPCRCEEDRR